jgi:hypothetical protein
MHTEAELFEIAAELGLTADCAREMVAEHIARRNEAAPRYVRAHLNAVRDGKITCAKVQRYLDRKFGFNAENVHAFLGGYVRRNRVDSWEAC